MEFDTLLYVLFIVGSFAFSIYQNYQKQKKKEQLERRKKQKARPESVQESKSLEEQLNEKFEKEYGQKEVTDDYEFTEPKDPEDYTSEGQDIDQLSTELERQRELSEIAKKIQEEQTRMSSEDAIPDEIERHEILKDFDARKAIIYSEIMKRPEY